MTHKQHGSAWRRGCYRINQRHEPRLDIVEAFATVDARLPVPPAKPGVQQRIMAAPRCWIGSPFQNPRVKFRECGRYCVSQAETCAQHACGLARPQHRTDVEAGEWDIAQLLSEALYLCSASWREPVGQVSVGDNVQTVGMTLAVADEIEPSPVG